MPGKKDAGDTDRPQAAGWYPDPWSATGEGERYYDGKNWGSSARPLARHTQTPPAPGASVTPITSGRRRKVGRFTLPRLGASRPKGGGGLRGWWARFRNRYGPLLILIALVLLVWGLPKVLDARHNNKDVFVPEPTPSTVPVIRPSPSTAQADRPYGVPGLQAIMLHELGSQPRTSDLSFPLVS